MQYSITAPSTFNATIKLPASKSISNRALIIHALSHGNIMPRNLSDCDDTEVMVNALRDMPQTIDIKAAGTAMRFLTAFLSVADGEEHIITGTERMKHRPIGILVDALRYLGADITYVGEEGFPPLLIKGKPLDGGRIEIKGNVSSQYISALLMIGPVLKNGLELKMTDGIASRPYIDLTLWMMREFGADADWSEVDTVKVNPTPYVQRDYFIENDWSASSYWYEMLALLGDAEATFSLDGLMDGSKQGDSVVRYIFSLLGIKSAFRNKGDEVPTTVSIQQKLPCMLPRLDYDFSSSPDLAQTVVVACALKDIPFRFTGLASLKIKETDRIEALKTELRKLGYVLHDTGGDTLSWDGSRCEPTMEPLDTYEDHRMAMAFAPAAIKFPGLRINDPEVVSKSYPAFWDDLRHAGFTIDEY
ncbi:MAG: 3-phosphoshikimate 1-carboxyvinyltransferase [Prevotellaceae bacterium]|nr:3-phosphoshikimate 1-carboxyvinyltransferase [Prevotella sp.]MCI7786326.1 3-phosphoshikimate 1-carboxyvinyltransferase [Prevotella sp.]MDD5875968.1 3-phosphoshikimate 1-carboxyvinyltransferase [Prevotellaceae bacterium]